MLTDMAGVMLNTTTCRSSPSRAMCWRMRSAAAFGGSSISALVARVLRSSTVSTSLRVPVTARE